MRQCVCELVRVCVCVCECEREIVCVRVCVSMCITALVRVLACVCVRKHNGHIVLHGYTPACATEEPIRGEPWGQRC